VTSSIAARTRPNPLPVSIDTLRAHALGCYGYAKAEVTWTPKTLAGRGHPEGSPYFRFWYTAFEI
jgi:hypothetical protein